MLRFTLRRLLQGVVLLFVVVTLAYLLLNAGLGDVARLIVGPNASAEVVAQKTASLGLDQPLITRYLEWLAAAVTGDWGASWFTSQPVAKVIFSRVWVTLSIVIGTTIATAVIATALGVWAARRRGAADQLVQVLSVLGFAIPGFLIAIFLVNVFALNLGWFKPTGYVPLATSFGGWLSSVTLPIAALSIGAIAAVAAQVRGGVIDTLRQDWVRTMRSRGLSENRIVYKRVLRNAGGPALSVLALQFVGLLGGTVLVEEIFAIPGIGPVAVDSTLQGDIPLVMGVVVVTCAIVVLLYIIVDLAQAFLNPKLRVS